jgi:hypothetical protein
MVPELVTVAVPKVWMPSASAEPPPIAVALAAMVPKLVTVTVAARMPLAVLLVAIPVIVPVFVLVTLRVSVSCSPVGLPERLTELVQVWLDWTGEVMHYACASVDNATPKAKTIEAAGRVKREAVPRSPARKEKPRARRAVTDVGSS